MQDSSDARLVAGREAHRRHAWPKAYEELRAADAVERMSPEDLERLAEAAGWVGRLDDSIAVRERAHAAYLERGDKRRAGFLALLLGHDHFAKGQGSLASGWMRRAERLLEAEQDSIEYGHLLRAHGLMAKDPDEALGHARTAHALALRLGDRDLAALQLQEQGRILVAKGEVAKGLALIEEATVTAVSGELGPMATGDIYCTTIDVCRRLADYGRASEWRSLPCTGPRETSRPLSSSWRRPAPPSSASALSSTPPVPLKNRSARLRPERSCTGRKRARSCLPTSCGRRS